MSKKLTTQVLSSISEESIQITSKEASAENSLHPAIDSLQPIYEEEDDYLPHLVANAKKRRFSTNSTTMSEYGGDKKFTSEVVKGPCSCSGSCSVF
jgi:hypothetical protein